MKFIMIGEEIRRLRKMMGISQTELCEGICTQAEISKIENNHTAPLANTLYHIAKRLGVKGDYFFEVSGHDNLDYLEDLVYFLRKMIRKKDYLGLNRMVQKEKLNPIVKSNVYVEQLLKWHEGICLFYVKADPDGALELLYESLELTAMNKVSYNEREIEIMNSIGIIHFEIQEFEKAKEIFQKVMYQFKQLPIKSDQKIFTRLCYNFAKVLTNLNDFHGSIEMANKGIQACLRIDSLYVMGELYFQIGYNYDKLEEKSLSHEYFDKAIRAFSLQNNDTYIRHIEEYFLNVE